MPVDALTQKYLRVLTHRQHGGSVDVVFRGARRWNGMTQSDKFGGFAKDMFRTVAPFIARGASKFLMDSASSFAKGAELKDALKGAVLPALVGAFSNSSQAGKGRLRRLIGIKATSKTRKSRKTRKTHKTDKTKKSERTCKSRKPCKTSKKRKARKVKHARPRKVPAESLNF